MSTNSDANPARRRVDRTHLPQMVTMSPAPCRMIHVCVYRNDDGTHCVNWADVVGVLCVVETEYLKGADPGESFPRPGATHEEMADKGWKSNHPPNWFPVVWPVVAGGNADDEYPIRVLHERNGDAGEVCSTILVCTWPREEDRDRAVAAGAELLRTRGECRNWADLPTPHPAASPG